MVDVCVWNVKKAPRGTDQNGSGKITGQSRMTMIKLLPSNEGWGGRGREGECKEDQY